MLTTPALAPPAIDQPAPRQASYGLVTGLAARRTRRIVVSSRGHVLADAKLRGRRFSLRVDLPTGDLTLRVATLDEHGRPAVRSPEIGRAHV